MSRPQRASSLLVSTALLVSVVVMAPPVYAAPAATSAASTSVGGLAPTALTPTALAATSVTGWSTAVVRVKRGGEVARSVSVKPASVRTVLVQVRKGTSGKATTRSTAKTSATGAVTARFSASSAGTWYVRLSLPATAAAKAATTAWRKVIVSGTARSTTVSPPSVSPSTVLRGTSQKVSATAKPAGKRTVEVWAKAPGSSAYALRGTVISAASGAASLTWKAPTAGTWTYKAYVRPSLTRKGVWSATRTAAVTDKPAAVTSLVATPAATSVALSWTNPSAFLAKVVVVRTLAAAAAPTTPTGGTNVALASLKATSVTDTGLTILTAYRYTVFTLDSANRYNAGVSVLATTTDIVPGPVTNLAANTSLTTTSVALSWTNPVADLDHVVVRRTLAADPAPTAVTDGDAVALGSATATSVTDTGLTSATAYRYSVFTVGPNGGANAPVNVLATTMADSLSWSTGVVADPNQGGLKSISCPTATFCAAVDQGGFVVEFSGGTWAAPVDVLGGTNYFQTVSCASSTLCFASTLDGRIFAKSGAAWQLRADISDTGVPGLSCVESSPGVPFCLAGDYNNLVYVSVDGVTWSGPSSLPTTGSIRAVSCFSSTYCSIAGASGKTFTFTGLGAPPASAPIISADTVITAATVNAVDCVSVGSCVFVTSAGTAWKTGDVATTAMDASREITALSCASPTFCAAVDYGGYRITYNGSTWAAPVRPDPRVQLISVSCPTSTFCVAVEPNSFGWETRWNGATWTAVNPIDPYSGTTDVSCVSTTFCVVVDQAGRAVTFNGTGWSAPVAISSWPLVSLDCASTTMCWAGANNGEVYRFDGSTWTAGTLDANGEQVNDISCPTTTYCVLVTNGARYATMTGTTWSAVDNTGIGNALLDISCVSPTFCMAVTGAGTAQIFNGATWAAPIAAGTFLASIECSTTSSCMALDTSHQWLTWNGSTWTTPAATATTQPWWLSCTAADFCVGIGLSPLRSVTWDGAAWHQSADTSVFSATQAVSCATNRFCIAIDQTGRAHTGTR